MPTNIAANLTSPAGVAMVFDCEGSYLMDCGKLLAQLADQVGLTPTNASVALTNATDVFQGTCRLLAFSQQVSLQVNASQAGNSTALAASDVASDFIMDCNWKSGIATMAVVLSLAIIGGGALAMLACSGEKAKKEVNHGGARATAAAAWLTSEVKEENKNRQGYMPL